MIEFDEFQQIANIGHSNPELAKQMLIGLGIEKFKAQVASDFFSEGYSILNNLQLTGRFNKNDSNIAHFTMSHFDLSSYSIFDTNGIFRKALHTGYAKVYPKFITINLLNKVLIIEYEYQLGEYNILKTKMYSMETYKGIKAELIDAIIHVKIKQ